MLPDLARTRGGAPGVDLIPNGVDVDLFRTPQARPAELPPSPVAVYVGTLHEERVDVPCWSNWPGPTRPGHRPRRSGQPRDRHRTTALAGEPNVHLLGPVPYDRVPAFLQHADVVVVPHLVNPFTESLDPIKAYECLAAGRPTVATPVAGFRDLGGPCGRRDRNGFVAAVADVLDASSPPVAPPLRRAHLGPAGRRHGRRDATRVRGTREAS